MATNLNLTPVHVKKREKVGRVGSNPVWEVTTTGGLVVNILGKGDSFEILGTGPHRAVARYISEQKAPNLEWTQLNKADYVPVSDFTYLLPKYIDITNKMRKVHGDE